jgi:serine/threonine-protein phosphatase 5
LRQESFGYALNDAVSSLKSDPGYLKAYYRRAAAHMSLGKFKLALSDFELVSKRRPNDADAKKKFTECNKIVKKMAFERAIAVDRPEKTLAEMYQSLESISIEDDYDGPKLEGEKNVTLEFMKELMQHYKDQKKLHKKYAYRVRERLSLLRVEVMICRKVQVVGIFHQSLNFLQILINFLDFLQIFSVIL